MTMIAGGGVLEIASPLGQWSLATGERTTRRMWSPRIPADPLDMEGEAAAAAAALSRCLSSTEWIPEGRRRVRSVQGRWRALSGEGWRRSCSRCGTTGGGARDSWRPCLLCSWRPRLLCSSSESGRLAGARGAGRRRPTRAQLRRDRAPPSGAASSKSGRREHNYHRVGLGCEETALRWYSQLQPHLGATSLWN